MGNNVVITVGGKGRYFSDVKKLGIALQDGGESLWIDKSNTEADQIIGRDVDGNDYIVKKGSGGNIIKTPLPTEIRVVTPPHKTSYVDGEAIDYTGMVVKAYDAAGNVWTDSKHPDGVITRDELILNSMFATRSSSDMAVTISDIMAPTIARFQEPGSYQGIENEAWLAYYQALASYRFNLQNSLDLTMYVDNDSYTSPNNVYMNPYRRIYHMHLETTNGKPMIVIPTSNDNLPPNVFTADDLELRIENEYYGYKYDFTYYPPSPENTIISGPEYTISEYTVSREDSSIKWSTYTFNEKSVKYAQLASAVSETQILQKVFNNSIYNFTKGYGYLEEPTGIVNEYFLSLPTSIVYNGETIISTDVSSPYHFMFARYNRDRWALQPLLIWELQYGGRTAVISWARPGDNKILSTYLGINIA